MERRATQHRRHRRRRRQKAQKAEGTEGAEGTTRRRERAQKAEGTEGTQGTAGTDGRRHSRQGANLKPEGGDGFQHRADDSDAADGAHGDAVALVVQQPPNQGDHHKAEGDYDVGKVGVVMPVVPLVLQLQPGCAQIELYTEHLQAHQAHFYSCWAL